MVYKNYLPQYNSILLFSTISWWWQKKFFYPYSIWKNNVSFVIFFAKNYTHSISFYVLILTIEIGIFSKFHRAIFFEPPCEQAVMYTNSFVCICDAVCWGVWVCAYLKSLHSCCVLQCDVPDLKAVAQCPLSSNKSANLKEVWSSKILLIAWI